uniref:Uncharacterized protein n=1 Tax=Anguilla anguilla TaxID=7936 RepID=A0A0E9V716_ANGAN
MAYFKCSNFRFSLSSVVLKSEALDEIVAEFVAFK